MSDAEGFYRLTNLPPGEYTISAELPGFARFARPGIVVRAGINLVVDVSLTVGSLQETVQVTAETPMLDVDKPVQAVNISGELQRTLPLSSRRDYTDFLEATPGLNTYVNPQSGGGIYSLRGSTIESHVVQVDGADMSSFRQSRPDYIAVSSDALEDVQVKVAASDASAPLGNGVVINIATPSGTNQLKGSVSTAYASEDWNADNNPIGQANFSSIRQVDALDRWPDRPRQVLVLRQLPQGQARARHQPQRRADRLSRDPQPRLDAVQQHVRRRLAR